MCEYKNEVQSSVQILREDIFNAVNKNLEFIEIIKLLKAFVLSTENENHSFLKFSKIGWHNKVELEIPILESKRVFLFLLWSEELPISISSDFNIRIDKEYNPKGYVRKDCSVSRTFDRLIILSILQKN